MPGTTPGKKWPLRGSNSEVYGFPAGGGLVASDVPPSLSVLGASPFGLRPHKTEARPGVEVSGPAIRHLKPSVSDNLFNQFADIGFRI